MQPENFTQIVTDVATRIHEMRPDWKAYHEYPNYVGIYIDDHQAFMAGTANQTWDADYYPTGMAVPPDGGFMTGIPDSCTDVDRIAKRLVTQIEEYLRNREALPQAKADFLAALEQFRKACWKLTSTWEDYDQASNHEHPINAESLFPMSFDDWCFEVDQWAEVVTASFNKGDK